MKINIPIKYRPFLIPFVVLMVIFLLSVSATKIMVEKLMEVRSNIAEVDETNNRLEEKKGVLTGIDQANLKKFTTSAINAIPGENSSLLLLSSIRKLAQNRGIKLVDYKVVTKKSDAKGVQDSELTLSTEGSLTSFLSFVDDVKLSAPLAKISKVAISVEGPTLKSNLTINSLWAPLPKSVAKVDAPIDGMKATDQQLLSKISSLKSPDVSTYSILAPQGRDNPFTY